MANENVTIETNVTDDLSVNVDSAKMVEDLKAELERVKADADRYKNANDKLSKESADYKRQLRAKQTAEEQEAEAKAEADRLANEEREQLKAELNRMKAENSYKSISDSETVQKLIDAVSDADHMAIAEIISRECEKAIANAEQTWIENRPQVNYGGSSMARTKESIMAIKDATERQKAIKENLDLFSN